MTYSVPACATHAEERWGPSERRLRPLINYMITFPTFFSPGLIFILLPLRSGSVFFCRPAASNPAAPASPPPAPEILDLYALPLDLGHESIPERISLPPGVQISSQLVRLRAQEVQRLPKENLRLCLECLHVQRCEMLKLTGDSPGSCDEPGGRLEMREISLARPYRTSLVPNQSVIAGGCVAQSPVSSNSSNSGGPHLRCARRVVGGGGGVLTSSALLVFVFSAGVRSTLIEDWRLHRPLHHLQRGWWVGLPTVPYCAAFPPCPTAEKNELVCSNLNPRGGKGSRCCRKKGGGGGNSESMFKSVPHYKRKKVGSPGSRCEGVSDLMRLIVISNELPNLSRINLSRGQLAARVGEAIHHPPFFFVSHRTYEHLSEAQRFGRLLTSRSREPTRVKRGDREKREIPEKIRRPVASPGTFPTCEIK
ncbi:hypothetical protein PR048_022843 [Dryococelus australis]|uniref:Uncharacterized protein n=1 Tax=Dryococelus australis TaxID=614101 RepID=A0ABQ9GSG6_9NEOP|nr:hypothetical protein PR048_022843 [Dryococelus australis]